MSEEVQKSVRVRINVSRSVKGVVTPEVTVELTGPERWGDNSISQEALARSDALVAALEERYPVGGTE
jgi:hypothetical protein